jgi:O-antigen/teichoic acid export membrane protein
MDNYKQRSTVFNIITTFGTKIILLLGGFVVSVLLARLLGPEGKGVITAIFVVPTILISLADMGIRQATAHYIGKKLYPYKEIVSSVFFLWLISTVLTVLIVAVYYSYGSNDLYGWMILIIAMSTIPFKLSAQYLKGIMHGQYKIGTINVSELIGLVSNIAGVLVLVWLLDLGIYGAASVHLIVAVTIASYYIVIIKETLDFKIKFNLELTLNLFSKGISFALALFILNLNYKIDIIILERMVTAEQVGIYSVGVNIAELIWQLPTAIGMVLFSKSANSKNEIDAVSRSTRLLRITLMPIFFICLLIGAFSPYIINSLYGIAFSNASEIIRLLLPGIFVMVIFKILNADLAGRGFPLFALNIYILPLVLNVVLNVYLINVLGINGAAIASTVSYIVGGITFGFVYASRHNIKFSSLFIPSNEDIKIIKRVMRK